MFSHVFVHKEGVGFPACITGHMTRGQTPPNADPLPWMQTMRCYLIRSTSGRYASYWNAFLFLTIFPFLIKQLWVSFRIIEYKWLKLLQASLAVCISSSANRQLFTEFQKKKEMDLIYHKEIYMVVNLLLCNYSVSFSIMSQSQRQIAMISEMIHTASLIHDDVIDASAMRRGKPSVQHQWGQRKVLFTIYVN